MADPKDTPAWQRHTTDGSSQAAKQEHDASSSAIESVRKFLEEPAVKDAPYDKKKAFLLSKDISEEIIHQVMGRPDDQPHSDTDGSKQAARQEFEASKSSPTPDASSPAAQQEVVVSEPSSAPETSKDPSQPEYDASEKTPQLPAFVKTTDGSTEAAKQEFDASKPTSFTAAEFRASAQSPAPASSPASAPTPQLRRDLPPIVTYPEFLVQPQKPPPLVTVSRLVNTAYIAGALTASAYALSKFIIAPMADNMNEARHDLFTHTNDHVHDFNDRLSKLVSTIPSSAKPIPPTPAEFADSDADSTISDPTELFHRDVGTQTSPSLSRRGSSSSEAETEKPESVPTKQASRLRIIQSHLSEILQANDSNGDSNKTFQQGISETRHYVDNLYYNPPNYSYGTADSTSKSSDKKDKPDAVATLKAEIRGVKGVLLSAKRFPSAGRVGA